MSEIVWHRAYLHPRDGGETLEYILTELLGQEVAILEQRAGFNFDIANGAKFLHQGAEWVKGANGLREAKGWTRKPVNQGAGLRDA